MKKKQAVQFPSPSTQREKLIEIGSHLHQSRTQKDISLEEVSRKTQIPCRLLTAIEEANLTILPESIYIRGLIDKFAQVVGEDGQALSQAFPLDSPKQLRSRQLGWIKLNQPQLRPFHLYLLYIALVVGAVNGLSAVIQQSVNPIAEESVAVVSSLETATSPGSESTQQVVRANDSAEPVVIEVTLKDQSWLRVVVDGQVEFEGILPEGSQRTWVANDKLTLRTGNAGGVVVTLNDKKEQRLGIPGQVQEITYIARHKRS
jgi:cytoskeletal protein RodZ